MHSIKQYAINSQSIKRVDSLEGRIATASQNTFTRIARKLTPQVFLFSWTSACSVCQSYIEVLDLWYIDSYWKSIIHHMCECVGGPQCECTSNWIEQQTQMTVDKLMPFSCHVAMKGKGLELYRCVPNRFDSILFCQTTHNGRFQTKSKTSIVFGIYCICVVGQRAAHIQIMYSNNCGSPPSEHTDEQRPKNGSPSGAVDYWCWAPFAISTTPKVLLMQTSYTKNYGCIYVCQCRCGFAGQFRPTFR